MGEIQAAYSGQIGRGYPFFIILDDEVRRLPFYRLYAQEKSQKEMSFESGINRFLFSKKFDFTECF
jgi:hypothetical protein